MTDAPHRGARSRRRNVLLAAASLAAVLYLFALDLDRTSPGPLSATHAAVPELREGARCAACHGVRGRTMAEACAGCHAEVVAALAGAPGFHASLGPADPAACGLCHREHLGPGHALVDAQGFERAGFAARADYDHRGLAFRPEGLHEDLECAGCHALADAPAVAPGEARFRGLDPSCGGCHADPHGGRMADACASCHAQSRPFADLADLDHPGALALEGAHAGLACAACHDRAGPYAVEILTGPGERPPARACADCHATPHAASFVARAAVLADLVPAAVCARCHDAVHGAFDAPAADCPASLHAASGFALEPPHDRAACADCHGPKEESFAQRFPGRDAAACDACHGDPHEGQFAGDAFAAEGCGSCHGPHGFRPSTFDAVRHAATAFALEGAHARAACAACHAASVPPVGAGAPAGGDGGLADLVPRAFEGTPTDCAACHADPHAHAFAWAEPGLACSDCHTTEAFGDARARSFDHARATGFALAGAHARVACEVCHVPLGAPDAAGRTFGRAAARFERLAEARGPERGCASCHADPHGPTAWSAAGAPPDCLACHGAETFADAAERFDHGRFTGFALDGRHAAAGCETCHPTAARAADAAASAPVRGAPEDGLVPSRSPRLRPAAERFPGPPRACATCHADPHAGAFEAAAASAGCAGCHVTDGFELPAAELDHAWTGYPLVGPHAVLACAACHRPHAGGAADALGRRFERARGVACSDCHADPHAGQFAPAAGAPTDCARCHADARTFAFDHARTRFPLDERHAALACGACHVRSPLAGGGEAVRYRPLGTSCEDCHGFGGGR